MTKILALFGKSGSGKDTIKKLLLDEAPQFFNEMISCTTRPKREDEVDGKDYHFMTREEFAELLMMDKFLEAQEYNGWFYGSCLDDLDPYKINLGIFTPDGIRCLKDEMRFMQNEFITLPIYVKCADIVRLNRIINRHEANLYADITEIARRFRTDQEDFANLDFDYEIVYNNKEPMDKQEILEIISTYTMFNFL